MSREGPRGIGELLQSTKLSRLQAEVTERRELASRVRAVLPAEAAAHVAGASLDDEGRLVVAMDSAAWAARLRYSTDELLGLSLRVRVAVTGEAAGRDRF
jgi:hypothetical protein